MQSDKRELEKEIAEMRTMGEDIYSFSKLETANECMYAYKLAYIDKDRDTKDNIYAFLGGVVHDSLERIYNGEDVDIVQDFEDGVMKAKEQGLTFPSPTTEEGYLACMRHFVHHFAPDDLKGLQEYLFVTEVAGHKMMGLIDRVTKDPDSEGKTLRVIDYKTSTAYAKKDLAKKGRQLVLYAYALEKEKKQKVSKVCWDLLKYVRIKYSGKTRKKKTLYKRDEYVKAFQTEILNELESLGADTMGAIDIYAEHALVNAIPKEVADKFTVSNGYLEYVYNEETKKDLEEYVSRTVEKIQNETEFKPKVVNKDTVFLCQNLCNYRHKCPALQKYLDDLKHYEETMQDETESGVMFDFEELF